MAKGRALSYKTLSSLLAVQKPVCLSKPSFAGVLVLIAAGASVPGASAVQASHYRPTPRGQQLANAIVVRSADVPGWGPMSHPPQQLNCVNLGSRKGDVVGFKQTFFADVRNGRGVSTTVRVYDQIAHAQNNYRVFTWPGMKACLSHAISRVGDSRFHMHVVGSTVKSLRSTVETSFDFRIHANVLTHGSTTPSLKVDYDFAVLRQGRIVTILSLLGQAGPRADDQLARFVGLVGKRMARNST